MGTGNLDHFSIFTYPHSAKKSLPSIQDGAYSFFRGFISTDICRYLEGLDGKKMEHHAWEKIKMNCMFAKTSTILTYSVNTLNQSEIGLISPL